MSEIDRQVALCTSCGKPKHKLKSAKSRILPGVPVYLCSDCDSSKMEPRSFVILAGRQYGFEHIQRVIKKKLYIGDEITLKELS